MRASDVRLITLVSFDSSKLKPTRRSLQWSLWSVLRRPVLWRRR